MRGGTFFPIMSASMPTDTGSRGSSMVGLLMDTNEYVRESKTAGMYKTVRRWKATQEV